MLILSILGVEAFTSPTATQLAEGKVKLTQSGATFAQQLTPQAKQLLAYVIGVGILMSMVDVVPKYTYGLTTLLLLGAIYAHDGKNGHNSVIDVITEIPTILKGK